MNIQNLNNVPGVRRTLSFVLGSQPTVDWLYYFFTEIELNALSIVVHDADDIFCGYAADEEGTYKPAHYRQYKALCQLEDVVRLLLTGWLSPSGAVTLFRQSVQEVSNDAN